MSRFLLPSLALLFAAGVPEARAEENTPTALRPPSIVVRGSTRTIGLDEQVGDVLVIDGKVEIAGVVRGHLFSLDAAVVVRSTAVVLESMTIQRGTIHIEDGAVLPAALSVNGARVFNSQGELKPKSGEHVPLGRSGTIVELAPTKLSTGSVALMKSVLPFDRFAPRSSTSIDALGPWHPGLGLNLRKQVDDAPMMTLAGLTKLSFVTKKVVGSFQRGYRGSRGTLVFSAISLVDEAASRALWDEIVKVAPAAKVSLSVKTALGEGAHWFFRRKDRTCMLWRKGAWFFAIETKLSANNATVLQEKQFSDQVLAHLSRTLDVLERDLHQESASVEGVKE